MKIGIVNDIHNNLIALEAVLNKIENECDMIICSGDIIGIGPYPEETVQKVMQIENLIAVKGNHEKYLIEGLPNDFPNEERMDIDEMYHHKWEHSKLSDSSITFLNKLPYIKTLETDGKKIAVMHYALDMKNNYVKCGCTPTPNYLDKIFYNVNADIIIYGHEHNKNICCSNKTYINVGSLGCPGRDKNIARYGILELTNNNINIYAKEIKYNSKAVVDKINELNYPASNEIKTFFYGIN